MIPNTPSPISYHNSMISGATQSIHYTSQGLPPRFLIIIQNMQRASSDLEQSLFTWTHQSDISPQEKLNRTRATKRIQTCYARGNLTLDLSNLSLTSIPNLSHLHWLTTLKLGRNKLTSFDNAGLTRLRHIDINGNKLTSFSCAGLTSLITLDLGNNQFTSFSCAGLTSLTTLDLGNNPLSSFSGAVLTALTTLYLNCNQFASSTIIILPPRLLYFHRQKLLGTPT